MTRENKIALISGVTEQDGAYLSELLLGKGRATLATRNTLHFDDLSVAVIDPWAQGE